MQISRSNYIRNMIDDLSFKDIRLITKLLRLSSYNIFLNSLRDLDLQNAINITLENKIKNAFEWLKLQFGSGFLNRDNNYLAFQASVVAGDWPAAHVYLSEYITNPGLVHWIGSGLSLNQEDLFQRIKCLMGPKYDNLRFQFLAYEKKFVEPYLSKTELNNQLNSQFLAKSIWSEMSLDERELFHAHCDFLNFENNHFLIADLNMRSDQRVLDLGAGGGLISSQIADSFGCQVSELDLFSFDSKKSGVEITGSIFEDLKAQKFDYIIMAWILHDWSDLNCERILLNALKMLKDDGRILVLEQIQSDIGSERNSMMDLLVHLHTGGGERSLREYKGLFARNGLTIEKWIKGIQARDLMVLSR